jgi:hypothetical protein
MAKRFLVGVANINAYNKATNDLLFTSKTMLDTAIEVTTGSQEIAGGQGNPLQYVYFHSPKLNMTLTEVQFNLAMVAANVGSAITTGANIWYEEAITLTAGGAGTVSATPLVTPGATSTIYGWATNSSDVTTRVTFTGLNFTVAGASSGDVVCVRYYKNNSAAQQVVIPANFVPANVRLVMDCQLASSDTSSVSGASIIGRVQFEIGSAQLSGAQTINMTSTGVSNTPLKAVALADKTGVTGCTGAGIYGKITQIVDSSNWYDTVTVIGSSADPVNVSSGSSTFQLVIYAIPSVGSAFVAPAGDFTYVSSSPSVCSVSSTGLITRLTSGNTTITATVTGKTSLVDSISVVSA